MLACKSALEREQRLGGRLSRAGMKHEVKEEEEEEDEVE
jgi:hypothetical protein